MGLFNKKKETQKRLDAAMLAINSILNEIYSNKATDEYKMKGDITKSPSYKNIEQMVTDLKTLKGYNQVDANDLRTMFQTLHRPIFKTMVKEYIMEHNDRNTIYTSFFTIGYRLLVGELTRIFASTEATSKGLVYKPDKVSKKNDASKMIKLFNGELERKVDQYVKDMKEDPENAMIKEYFDMLVQEADTDVADSDMSADTDPDNSTEQDSVDAVTESDEEKSEITQEGKLGEVADEVGKAADVLTSTSRDLQLISTSVGVFSKMFGAINGLFRGFNPVSDINFYFMNSYDKKIKKFEAVSKMYEETKKAYDEYMRIPEAQRNKKVESKYMKNMEKYNIAMQNLSAQVEHFNQRAEKESSEMVTNVEKKIPTNNTGKETPDTGTNNNDSGSDADFQF